jgi:NADPH-dependent curcumin reductase CurA
MRRHANAHAHTHTHTHRVQTVLRKEYPKGVDVVYEGVGGAMFDAALANLADRGRLVVIGMMDS